MKGSRSIIDPFGYHEYSRVFAQARNKAPGGVLRCTTIICHAPRSPVFVLETDEDESVPCYHILPGNAYHALKHSNASIILSPREFLSGVMSFLALLKPRSYSQEVAGQADISKAQRCRVGKASSISG